jgi:hypothetical protein
MSEIKQNELSIFKDDKIAIVFGAGCNMGKVTTQLLLIHKSYKKVIAITHIPLGFSHDQLDEIVVDFNIRDSWITSLVADDLFLFPQGIQFSDKNHEKIEKYQLAYDISLICVKQGLNQILVQSSEGADRDALFNYFRHRGLLEKSLESIGSWALHIFRPGIVLEDPVKDMRGGEISSKIKQTLDRYTWNFLSRYTPIEAHHLASTMVKAAQGMKPGVFVYGAIDIQGK